MKKFKKMPNFPKREFVKKKFAPKKTNIPKKRDKFFKKWQIPQKMKKCRQNAKFPKKRICQKKDKYSKEKWVKFSNLAKI